LIVPAGKSGSTLGKEIRGYARFVGKMLAELKGTWQTLALLNAQLSLKIQTDTMASTGKKWTRGECLLQEYLL
jgi:hypothetical protein